MNLKPSASESSTGKLNLRRIVEIKVLASIEIKIDIHLYLFLNDQVYSFFFLPIII